MSSGNDNFLSKFPTYQRVAKWMRDELGRRKTSDGDSFDFGIDDDQSQQPIKFPPQKSVTDTSNWDSRVSIAPDGREHIKDLDPDSNITSK